MQGERGHVQGEGGKKASSTPRDSQAVPHPSTNRALRCLTAEFGRDPVFSTRYGRWHFATFYRGVGARLRPPLLPQCACLIGMMGYRHASRVWSHLATTHVRHR